MPARCCLLFRLHYLLRCNALVVCTLSPCCRLSPCLAAPTTLADDDKNVLWVLAPSLSNSRPPFTHLAEPGGPRRKEGTFLSKEGT